MNPTGAQIKAIHDTRRMTPGASDWDVAGIRAALTDCDGDVSAIMAGASLAAGDAGLRVPSAKAFVYRIPPTAPGTARAPQRDTCYSHPDRDRKGCPDCEAEARESRPLPGGMTGPEFAKAALAEAKAAEAARQAEIQAKREASA